MADNKLYRRVVARIHEAIEASANYQTKEAVRQDLQELIADAVRSGAITSQEELDDWFKTASMALGALKMVPFGAFQALSRKK
jgi:hypothetical protein